MEGRTGSHVACDMLRTSEGRIADGAFVITGHWEEGREERAREKERKKRWLSQIPFLFSSLGDVVVEL